MTGSSESGREVNGWRKKGGKQYKNLKKKTKHKTFDCRESEKLQQGKKEEGKKKSAVIASQGQPCPSKEAHTHACVCAHVMRELTVRTICAGCWDAAPPDPLRKEGLSPPGEDQRRS